MNTDEDMKGSQKYIRAKRERVREKEREKRREVSLVFCYSVTFRKILESFL